MTPFDKYYYGEGKRVKKFISATNETTVFVYSSGKLVAEYSTATPPANPTINYTATDMLGSPRVVTNALGNVVSRRDFMPFGEDVPTEAGDRNAVADTLDVAEGLDSNGNLRTTALNYQASDNIRQRFTGYQKDTETSLDFAEARMYESRYGRFTAVDPLLASGKSDIPQSFNRYIYVRNAPFVLTDKKGKSPGDYYDRNNNYLGSDGKDDGKFYYADEIRRDENWIYIKNVVATTCDKVNACRTSNSEAKRTLGTDPSNFETIPDRANFYGGFSRSNANGVRWPGAASDVSNQMDWLTRPLPMFLGRTNTQLSFFANRGNKTIFDDVFWKLAALKEGGQLSAENAFKWDALTLSQEQSLIQPLYKNLDSNSLGMLENTAKGNFFGSSLFVPKPFPQDRDIMNVSHRWEFGMKLMGYTDVTPNQMPDPGKPYRTAEMYNRLNPARPMGPIVVKLSF